MFLIMKILKRNVQEKDLLHFLSPFKGRASSLIIKSQVQGSYVRLTPNQKLLSLKTTVLRLPYH